MRARVRSTYQMPDINSVTGAGRFSGGGCFASHVRLVGLRACTGVDDELHGRAGRARVDLPQRARLLPLRGTRSESHRVGQSLRGWHAIDARHHGANRSLRRRRSCGDHELVFDHAELNRERTSVTAASRIDNRAMAVTQIRHQQAQCVAMGRARRCIVRKLQLWPEARIPVDACLGPVRIEVTEHVPRNDDVGESCVQIGLVARVWNCWRAPRAASRASSNPSRPRRPRPRSTPALLALSGPDQDRHRRGRQSVAGSRRARSSTAEWTRLLAQSWTGATCGETVGLRARARPAA